MKALGYRNTAIGWHYLKWALIIGAAGVVLGVVLGASLGTLLGKMDRELELEWLALVAVCQQRPPARPQGF